MLHRIYTSILMTLFLSISYAQAGNELNTIKLVHQSANSIQLKFKLDTFYKIPVQGNEFIIKADNASALLQKGAPDLSKITASLIIPQGANTSIKIISSKFTDYTNINIAPSKGNIKRNIDPKNIPYSYDQNIYSQDAFFPNLIAEQGKPYVLRDVGGQSIIVYPFQYNPVTKTLRIYSEIELEIQLSGNSFTQQPMTINNEFHSLYARHFLNYNYNSGGKKSNPDLQYTPIEEEGNMLIISDPAFIPVLQPFIEWKRQRGIHTEIVDVTTIGVDEVAIKN